MPASRFQTTEWSLVLAAGQGSETSAERALSRLCALYWHPVFAFVRRKGHPPEDARDLTQGFFTRLIEKNAVGEADRNKGRFRTFLLTSCQNYLANERDHKNAGKRGGGIAPQPLDVQDAELRYARAIAHDETPERAYDRQWCLTLLDQVFDTLRAEYDADGKAKMFDRLKSFVTAEDDAGTHADAARELQTTAGAVKVAVHRLRRRFRDELLRQVADTLGPDQDVEDEIRYLLDAVGPARGHM